MKQTKLLDYLQRKIPSLSKGQRHIAGYILANYDDAAFMTAKQIGDALGISESTVVRFAKRVGFAGFPEFQRALKDDIRNILTIEEKLNFAHMPLQFDDLVQKSLRWDLSDVQKTMENLDHQGLKRFVSKMMQGKNIYVLGLRSSRVLSDYLTYYLNLFHPHAKNPTLYLGDMIDQLINITKDDVVILISFPRYSSKVVEVCEFLKREEVPILAITDATTSPLCAYAEESIFATYSYHSFIDSLVAPMALINALILALAYENKEKTKEKFEFLADMWNKHSVYF